MNDSVLWKINRAFFFIFEIETAKIQSHLPTGIRSIEPRPGISLLAVGGDEFMAGNLGHLPVFVEINLNIMVQPNLSAAIQMPKYAIYTPWIAADSQAFIDHAHHVDKMKIYQTEALKIDFQDGDTTEPPTSRQPLSVSVEDKEGPIIFLQNTHPSPVFEVDSFWGQYATSQDGDPYLGNFQWSGVKFEHQKTGSVGKIYDHPFWGDIDIEGLEQRCYLQMMSAPGTVPEMRMYAPKLTHQK